MLDTGLDTGKWLIVRLLLLQYLPSIQEANKNKLSSKYIVVMRNVYIFIYIYISFIRNDTYIYIYIWNYISFSNTKIHPVSTI